MTESFGLARNAPAALDPFDDQFLLDPYPSYEMLRDAGPLVFLEAYDSWATGRHEVISRILSNHHAFCSGRGVGLANFDREKPWRKPSLLLETDPPAHTVNRTVISRALSPSVQRELRATIEEQAAKFVEEAVRRKTVEAVDEFCNRFPLRVFADAVGVPEVGREHLIAYGSMVFNTMGPKNDNYRRAMENHEEVIDWVSNACLRSSLRPDGLGAMIYQAADMETIDEDSAALIVRSFLSAGIDTTAAAAANLLFLFAEHPEQWQKLKQDPSLTRNAIEEVLRLESPFQMFFRTTTEPVVIDGVQLAENEKVLLCLGAANRDPSRWTQPNEFDITRKATGHLAFGMGIHGCVGQNLARLELELLVTALLERVAAFEIEEVPVWLQHNTLRTLKELRLRFVAD
ncbi:MAG: cytochrome P450 [Hyphomicrobiaceae bacterium]